MKHAGNAPLLIACNKSELSDSISDEAIDMADQNGYQVDASRRNSRLKLLFLRHGPSRTMTHCVLVILIKSNFYLKHFNVSAKTSDGVESLFKAAAQNGVPTAIERLEESLNQSV